MKSFFRLLIVILLIGCDRDSRKLYSGDMAANEELASITTPDQNEKGVITKRKLIKEGVFQFETEDISKTRNDILKVVKNYKGYASSDQEYKTGNGIKNTIVIRVPANNFDFLIKDLTKGISKFDDKNITVKDITEEFLDIEARVKTKKELENRYLEILKKANTVTEMLEVEQQLEKLRAEIESIEGRLKYLNNRTSLSTITITFYQIIEVEKKSRYAMQFKKGFKNGWTNLIDFFIVLINIWPFILIMIGVLFGV